MDAAVGHLGAMCAIGLMFIATTCRPYGLLSFVFGYGPVLAAASLRDVINSCLLALAKSHGQTSMTSKVRISHKAVCS